MLGKKSYVFQKIFWVLLVCLLFVRPASTAGSDSDFFDLCTEGSLKQVVDAVNDGADVNARGYGGRTPLMLAAPSAAIDLPLKILVAEDAQGKVWISYNSPEYLKERHGLPDNLLPNIAVVQALAAAAGE